MPNVEKPPFPSLAEVAQRLEAEEKARKQEEAVTSLQPACLTDEVDIETWEAEFPSNLPVMRVPAQEEPKASGPGPSWNKTSFGDISQHCGITRQHAGYS